MDYEKQTENSIYSTEQIIVEKDSSSDEAEYELKVEAHKDCKNYQIIEAIEVNFDSGLDDLKILKDDSLRYVLVQRLKEKYLMKKMKINIY